MTHPFAVLGFVVVLTLVVYFAALAFGRARDLVKLRCPERGADYDVVFDCRLGRTWDPGRRLDVVRCSAFGDGAVACDKRCLSTSAS